MTTITSLGVPTGGKPINLHQLEAELVAGGVGVSGLGLSNDAVYTYDAAGQAADFETGTRSTVDQIVADHIALRDRTDEEYATEFQDAATTAVRRQEIRDITAGLLPREQVRVDNGQPIDEPVPQADPLEAIRAVPLGSTTDELRDAIVAYLERFGG
jgi:hypothetical protein